LCLLSVSIRVIHGLAAPLFLLVTDNLTLGIIWLLGTSVSICYLSSPTKPSTKPYWWRVFLVLGLRFTARNLFTFYILFEFRLVPILIMILALGAQPERLAAGLFFLLYTRVVSIPYLCLVIAFLQSTKGFIFGSLRPMWKPELGAL